MANLLRALAGGEQTIKNYLAERKRDGPRKAGVPEESSVSGALSSCQQTRSAEGVQVALAKCEAIFRLQEPKKRMRDQAAHACRALCRTRVAEELQRRRERASEST